MDMVLHESGILPVKLDLYSSCKPHFNGSILREILQAEAGMKVSRVVLSAAKATVLHDLATRFGFAAIDSTRRYIISDDAGKGRFSNRSLVNISNNTEGAAFTYIAQTKTLALAAREGEEADDSEGFGLLLGIPPCCRQAYCRFRPHARQSQGDLLPLVWANSPWDLPFDPWLNIAARYFGSCLISFFPCSFRCAAASNQARQTYDLLHSRDAAWAQSFLAAHNSNILYTERHGVYQFTDRAIDGVICYEPENWVSTQSHRIGELLHNGNQLRIVGAHHVEISRDKDRIGSISGGELRVCIFRT